MIANTPKPPYYAVLFSSIKVNEDHGYSEMADLMLNLAQRQKGFLGIEHAKNELGITISYWKDLKDIKNWKQHSAHLIAQQKGMTEWYKYYKVRIAKVERDYDFKS